MDTAIALWNQFAGAHPIYSHGLALLIGTFAGPRLLTWWDEKGVKQLTNAIDARQEALLKRAGLTDEQIDDIQLHEAKDMRISADEMESRVKRQREERAAKAAAPAAPAVSQP